MREDLIIHSPTEDSAQGSKEKTSVSRESSKSQLTTSGQKKPVIDQTVDCTVPAATFGNVFPPISAYLAFSSRSRRIMTNAPPSTPTARATASTIAATAPSERPPSSSSFCATEMVSALVSRTKKVESYPRVVQESAKV